MTNLVISPACRGCQNKGCKYNAPTMSKEKAERLAHVPKKLIDIIIL